jgi:non-heme chloroperoxidase
LLLSRLVALFSLLVVMGLSAPIAQATVSRFFMASDGTQLHYLSDAPPSAALKPTLVFVPGWSMPASLWQAQLIHFSRTHRVVAFDPRSQGRSQVSRAPHTPERRAQDIAELLDHLGLREDRAGYVLVGWSLGVLESLTFLTNHGERGLQALVLVDNSIGEDPPPPNRQSNFLKNLRDSAKRRATVDGFVRSMFRSQQDDAFLESITEAAMRMPAAASVQLLSQPFPRTYWREAVYKVEKPVYYMVTPKFEGQAQNFRNRHRQARVSVFEGAGHALFVDEAPRFNDLLGQFLAEVESVSPPAAKPGRPVSPTKK